VAADAGWFQDTAKPWVAHHWDGQRWTGEAHSGGRTRTVTSKPQTPPDPRRRIELDQLPSRAVGLGPPGLFPFVVGVLVGVLLLPAIYEGIEDIQTGSMASDALPAWLVVVTAGALASALYGIVNMAVTRAHSRSDRESG